MTKLLEASEGRFEGRVTDLLEGLRDRANEAALRDRRWPADPIRLSGELRRLAPAFRAIGVAVEFPKRTAGARRIVLRLQRQKAGKGTSRTSSTSSDSPLTLTGDVHDDDDVESGESSSAVSNVKGREPGEEG